MLIVFSDRRFYGRWKESELLYARLLNFSLNEAQVSADWANLLLLASQPGSSLEQLHIFALAHILRRPIIVYGVKFVKSYRGETLGYARFEGWL
jgi:ubiquitin thioesterase ZRANB1